MPQLNDLEQECPHVLHELENLASGHYPAMDQICKLACKMFSVPVAAVIFSDAENQRLMAQSGLDPDVELTPLTEICNYTILADGVLVVPDALRDNRFTFNAIGSAGVDTRFYAGAPLEIDPGIKLGALCVIAYEPRSFSPQDCDRLAQLATLIVNQVRLNRKRLKLSKYSQYLAHLEEELLWTTTHDSLTRLPNRVLFTTTLEAAVNTVKANGGRSGLMIIDIDDFKRVNDIQGYNVGDTFLVAVTERLSSLIDAPDMLARLGGDEFAILIHDASDLTRLTLLAESMNYNLCQPVTANGAVFKCSASIGLTVFPDHASSPTEILRSADLALYAAKAEGRNRTILYKRAFREQLEAKIEVLDRARQALETNSIVPYYQPKVCLRSGVVIGFEALLRWHHPILGIQTPQSIWDAFADPILSVEIGHRMRQLVLADMAAWTKLGVPFGAIAINISSAEFTCGDFAKHIHRCLQEHGLSPDILQLEVTETVFLGDGSGDIGNALRSLSEDGIAIALDDFGTGYASLMHLRSFPVGWLKIDKSFVTDMCEHRKAAVIVNTCIELAQSFGMGVVAEGVESIQQLKMLKELNCDVGQGYLFSRPMDSSAIPEFLTSWSFPEIVTS
ncbi:sensor domain-containing phosphodiesterase [Agrobacterium cavarae]|uniref:sensor domain-containing phosphodiesterase n=1 Tax=Agrobacterium cavarae TaxID=2528239 RepID=UPI00289B431B|nr:EAL domain-containing protein [Agrobacterium cavarae]